jgi:tetratricopeptide (TPR) repeat protein
MFSISPDRSQNSWLSNGLRQLCLLAACVSLLTACAATNGGSYGSQNTLEKLSREADTELAKGQREKAVALLNQAAKENPTSMVPWLKLANIWFESGNYPSSILAANEVLQRDAGNQEAQAMMVVSGLRVAAGAVTGLRSVSSVNAGARAEAENLTNALRAVVGETVLIPNQTEAGPAVSTARAKHPSSAKPNPGPAVSPAKPAVKAPPKSSPASGGADPFKSLK